MNHRPRKEPERLSWDFSSCPPEETEFLYSYEFSRESEAIRKRVAFIRHGQILQPTYWTPNPDFGWPEWPEWPFLWIPKTERARRRKALDENQVDAELVLLDLRSKLFQIDRPIEEISSTLLRFKPKRFRSVHKQRIGRAALKAKLPDRLRILCIHRLLQYHSAAATKELLREAYSEAPYADTSALNRAHRKYPKYLEEFEDLAFAQVEQGLWFPPFGRTLIADS